MVDSEAQIFERKELNRREEEVVRTKDKVESY